MTEGVDNDLSLQCWGSNPWPQLVRLTNESLAQPPKHVGINCFNFEPNLKTHMDNNTFQSVLEQVVLAQNPELFIYASKLNKGMIPTPKYVIVKVYKDSSLFPQPPRGFKFKEPSSMAYVRASVMSHNMISNELLLEDGTWVPNRDQNSSESSWIRDIEPIEEPKKELTPKLGYTTEEDIF